MKNLLLKIKYETTTGKLCFKLTEPRAGWAVVHVNIVFITEIQQLYRIYYDQGALSFNCGKISGVYVQV